MRLLSKNTGFSLIELLIAMVLTGIVSVAVFSLFISQNRSFDVQEQRVALHQNLRAAMEIMQRDLRMAGFDPTGADNFLVTDVRNRDQAFVLDPNGEGAIQFTADLNANGTADVGETFDYSIDDPDADLIPDLRRNDGTGQQMLGEGVEVLRFAYAFTDSTGVLVMNPNATLLETPEPLWAFDGDSDNLLDAALDTNGSGTITTADNGGGLALTNFNDSTGNPLPATVQLDRIRAVKIWMLGRVLQPDPQYQPGNLIYKVGNRNFNHPNDNLRRKVLTSVVKFRNLGL